jgi:hypothetical protein
MKIKINESDDTISVLVSVAPLKGKNKVREKILHKDVMKYLSQQEVEVGACLKSPSSDMVTNKSGHKYLSGEWVFEKPKKSPVLPEPPPQVKKSAPIKKKPVKTIKKVKKVKKTLDKSPEDVIIYIQEETLPSKE